jgi:Pyridoxamine 5'-phosphate oxidase
MADLAELARTTLSRNRFMVLGTVDPSGRPRVSPVWFSLVDHRVAYWLSSPRRTPLAEHRATTGGEHGGL